MLAVIKVPLWMNFSNPFNQVGIIHLIDIKTEYPECFTIHLVPVSVSLDDKNISKGYCDQ
jgi:hypothetical protein